MARMVPPRAQFPYGRRLPATIPARNPLSCPDGRLEQRPSWDGGFSMTPRRSRQVGLLCLLVTAVGWGLNWPAIKVLLHEWPPLFARGTAGVAAALGLALLAAMRGQRLAVPGPLVGRLVAAAAINVLAWMGLSTLSMLLRSAGEGALLVYTMPIWATLLAWPILGERPTVRSLTALALGIAGVEVLLGGQDLSVGSEKLPGVLLALAAAGLFALGTVALRPPLALPALTSVAWQVGLGCLPMVAWGLLFEKPALDRQRVQGGVRRPVLCPGRSIADRFVGLRYLTCPAPPPAAAASSGTAAARSTRP